MYTSPLCKQICTQDTHVQRQGNGASPPPDNIANKVNLLLTLILRPEANTAQEERPVNGGASIGM